MPKKLPTISGGSGPRLVRHTGGAACIELRDDEGELLAPDVLLERERHASILIAREPIETVSPETMLARLTAADVRVIIAPGFEARFYQRCVSCGVLALPLEQDAVNALAEWVSTPSPSVLTVDLDRQVIEPSGTDGEALSFEVDPRIRRKLLLGLTDEEEMLEHFGSTAALRTEDRKRRPWLYDSR